MPNKENGSADFDKMISEAARRYDLDRREFKAEFKRQLTQRVVEQLVTEAIASMRKARPSTMPLTVGGAGGPRWRQ